MASLEPPSRPYIAMGPGQTETTSARTSTTHIEMSEGENNTHIMEQRPTDPTSHELPQSLPNKEAPSAQTENEPKNAPENPGTASVDLQVPQTPQVYLTFLVISGKRRTMSFEPETTLGRVKELVWNSWPTELEAERPLAPSYLRILYFGKMLQDDDTLTELKFPTHTPQSTPPPTPTIVHLSIRPFAPAGDNDLKKKRNRNRNSDGTPPSPGSNAEADGGAGCCGCVIC